jgi:hypothetical protein
MGFIQDESEDVRFERKEEKQGEERTHLSFPEI